MNVFISLKENDRPCSDLSATACWTGGAFDWVSSIWYEIFNQPMQLRGIIIIIMIAQWTLFRSEPYRNSKKKLFHTVKCICLHTDIRMGEGIWDMRAACCLNIFSMRLHHREAKYEIDNCINDRLHTFKCNKIPAKQKPHEKYCGQQFFRWCNFQFVFFSSRFLCSRCVFGQFIVGVSRYLRIREVLVSRSFSFSSLVYLCLVDGECK